MEYSRDNFLKIVYETASSRHERFNIGTYKEKEMHVILKKYFEPDAAFHEKKVNGFIADICRDNKIIEIETSGFSGLKPKLEAYLGEYKVTLVHPLAASKYVSWIEPETAEILPRKKSPKKEGIYDLLFEMVYILPYVSSTNLSFVAPLLEVDEYKLLNGWSRDKKRGATKFETIPSDLLGMIELKTDADFLSSIPEALAGEFTSTEFAKAAKIDSRKAYAVVKVLLHRGVIEECGKKGRAAVYGRRNLCDAVD